MLFTYSPDMSAEQLESKAKAVFKDLKGSIILPEFGDKNDINSFIEDAGLFNMNDREQLNIKTIIVLEHYKIELL